MYQSVWSLFRIKKNINYSLYQVSFPHLPSIAVAREICYDIKESGLISIHYLAIVLERHSITEKINVVFSNSSSQMWSWPTSSTDQAVLDQYVPRCTWPSDTNMFSGDSLDPMHPQGPWFTLDPSGPWSCFSRGMLLLLLVSLISGCCHAKSSGPCMLKSKGHAELVPPVTDSRIAGTICQWILQ